MSSPGSRRIPGTEVRYDPDDLDGRGRISFIVTAPDEGLLRDARQAVLGTRGGKVTANLKVINGIVAEVALKQAPAFLQALPEGVRATVDGTLFKDTEPEPAG